MTTPTATAIPSEDQQYLPHITDLHSYGDLEQTQLLDLLFEPSPAIHASLIPVIRTAHYSSYPGLIDACQIRLLSLAASASSSSSSSFRIVDLNPSPNPALLSVLGSHPRLGAKKIESAQSAAEQARLQGAGGAPGEAEELARLNALYEDTFPGLRYVVFVNGRGRPEIMEDMRARIARADFGKEVAAAVQALCDIAKDRASKIPMREVIYASPNNNIVTPSDSYVSYRS